MLVGRTLKHCLLIWRELVEITTASPVAAPAPATTSTIATAMVTELKVTIGGVLLLLEVALVSHIEAKSGTKITTHAIRECICIIILPHSVALAIPACEHPLAGVEAHAHVHAVHTIHASIRAAKSAAKHAS